MANIKIYGDLDSGSIFFINSTVDPKALGTVVASLVDFNGQDRILVERNDRFQEDGVSFRVLFKKLNANRVCNQAGEELTTQLGYSVQQVVDYINGQSQLTGANGGDGNGTDVTDVSIDFKLDATSTSVMLDNGFAYGVNTIKAIADADGTIHIISEIGDLTYFTKLDHTNVSIDGVSASGGLNDVVNALNELFQVGAFEQVVISDPYSTMVADIDGVTDAGSNVGNNVIDPIGNDIAGATATHNNNAGYLSSETLNQAGEYFTFDIRGEGTIGFGLVHTQDSYDNGYYSGSSTYADPTTFCNGVNSAHYGYQFAHYFHPTPNGSWTNYGANTAYSMRSGWSSFPNRQNWLDGNPIKMRVGIDNNGYISIESYDPNTSLFVPHSRSSYVLPEGSEFKLGIKFSSTTARLYSTPKVHLLEEDAPTMYFRWIESPDGNYEWPLFATEEEANYYDANHTIGTVGTGTSHTHTYNDDPTNTTWYMPDTGSTMTDSQDPAGVQFAGQDVNWTEITSLTNSDLAPPLFTQADLTYQEGTVLNLQVTPAGATWSTSASISPAGSGLVFDGTALLQGTLSDVSADTDYTVTVTRGNSYGSTTGSFTLTATDVPPVSTNDTDWDKAINFSGGSEHLKQVTQSTGSNAIRMSGLSQYATANSDSTKTSNHSYSRPWATAIVFQTPNNTSNQHIWNSGEGTSTGSDNIYLRMTGSNGDCYFGWGREGVGYNEYKIGSFGGSYNQSSGQWWGIYIAHDGTRLNSADANATNLTNAFDIRLMGTNDVTPVFSNVYNVGNDTTNWTSTGVRMDRAVTGDFTIGGRGSNRSFHGKVASMVVTTLRRGVTMPTDAEIKLMLTDPVKWETDYKDGVSARYSYNGSNFTYGTNSNSKYATQIWLMGDGTSDSYANGIRNHVDPTDQNNTKLQLNSMVSNDIQTVSINGLS